MIKLTMLPTKYLLMEVRQKVSQIGCLVMFSSLFFFLVGNNSNFTEDILFGM